MENQKKILLNIKCQDQNSKNNNDIIKSRMVHMSIPASSVVFVAPSQFKTLT